MGIITHRKIWIAISSVFVIVSVVLISVFGLNLGIDFTGGALAEVSYEGERPAVVDIRGALEPLSLGEVIIQPTEGNGYILKMRSITEEERIALFEEALTIGGVYEAQEERFTSIGPSVGTELQRKAIIALIVVAIGIILFVAYAFRHVSKPVSSWKYGLVAIITLVHDVLITTGVFVILTQTLGAEADTLFIVALLTVLGLSVNDTIVVFDRVRENLKEEENTPFPVVVGHSIEQTIMRSIGTSASTLLVLFALFVLGPDSTKVFALTLGVGMIIGTYSSIFLASPLLVFWQPKEE